MSALEEVKLALYVPAVEPAEAGDVRVPIANEDGAMEQLAPLLLVRWIGEGRAERAPDSGPRQGDGSVTCSYLFIYAYVRYEI